MDNHRDNPFEKNGILHDSGMTTNHIYPYIWVNYYHYLLMGIPGLVMAGWWFQT